MAASRTEQQIRSDLALTSMEQMHDEVGADGLGTSIRLVGIEMTRMRDHPANLAESDDIGSARLDSDILWRDLQPI